MMPNNTCFYHGTHRLNVVTEMEWLSFGICSAECVIGMPNPFERQWEGLIMRFGVFRPQAEYLQAESFLFTQGPTAHTPPQARATE